MTGRFVAADEALTLGMVNEVVAEDKVLDRALEVATALANGPAKALAAAKRAIEQGIEVSLADGLKIESQEFANLFGTSDQVTGMSSFVENGPGKATFQ
jgi:enoyl-CoA hydratase